jgi:protein-S-isoprenylcysteine O-methyltransferase Ste14
MAVSEQDPSVRPNTVPWPPILLAGLTAGAVVLGRSIPAGWPGVDDAPARLIGLGIGLAGCVLVAWAVITLVRANTTVMPHLPVSRLVTDGPYAWRRNPIYLGETLMLLGLAELTKNIWFMPIGIAFAILVTWLAVLPEERHLEAKFGDAWRAYAENTRRLL